jgi:hypothetical protein
MTKDRNTFAKRQREMDRKHKADTKRQRRVKRKQEAATQSDSDAIFAVEQGATAATDSSSTLSSTQCSVLMVFRRFRMNPGRMLCFSRSDVEAYHEPLTELADQGLIVKEKFTGGYSLTPHGFAAMQSLA